MVTVMTYRSRSYFPLLFNKYIIHHNFCPKFHLKKPSTLWLLSPLILSQIKCWLHSKQVCFHLLILLLKYLSNHAEKIQNTRSNKNVKFFWRKPFSVETPSLGEKSFLGRSHFWGEALFGEKPFSGRSHFLGRSHFRGEAIFWGEAESSISGEVPCHVLDCGTFLYHLR